MEKALTTSRNFRTTMNGRLAFYSEAADAAFWAHHWEGKASIESFKNAIAGQLLAMDKPFLKWLPKDGKIIEAGCGTGWYVVALKERGYDVEGVDYAEETVSGLKELFPDLDFKAGDVTDLKVPEGYYSGYISLGVIEHREAGPEPFLEEASRVLEKDGIALISVPYFHPLRKLKAALNLYKRPTEDLHFYQYAFTKKEFTELVTKHGFEIVDTFNFHPIEGFLEEIPGVTTIMGWRPLHWFLARAIGRTPFVRRFFGHMIMLVARRV